MRFSLITTTRGNIRKPELVRLLRSLASQSVQFQFILVWQEPSSPDGELATLLKTIEAEIVFASQCSLSHARNLGLERATGDVVAFPDDDCWYSPGLLGSVKDAFSGHDADCICTAVTDPANNRSLGKRPRGSVQPVTFHNCLRLPISVGIFVRFDSSHKHRYHFDECLGAGCQWGSGEESDLIFRLLKSGTRIIYDGTIEVHHQVPQAGHLPAPAKAYSYGLGFGVLAGRFLCHGVASHLAFYVEMLGRSALGAALAVVRGDTGSARHYLVRLYGMVTGLHVGIWNSRARSSASLGKEVNDQMPERRT